MRIIYAFISEKGIRYSNEDAFNIVDMQDNNRWMGIVSDGMGGHTKGGVGSKVVVDAISRYWERNNQIPDSEEKSKKLESRHL